MEIKERHRLLLASAKKRNIKVHLNTQLYRDIISDNCEYCGDSLSDKNGYCLDRFDNTQGYENDNVVGCCQTCNYAKRQMTCIEFYSWIERVYNAIKQKETQVTILNKSTNRRIGTYFKNCKKQYFNQTKVKYAQVLRYYPEKDK